MTVLMIVLAASLLCSADAAAQGTSAILGRILGDDGRPIAGADVTMESAGRATRSDSSGRFHLDSLVAGAYVVQMRAMGYQPRFARATVFGHDTATFDAVLDRAVPSLAPIVVHSSRPPFASYDEFERRRLAGSGSFLTFDYLAKQGGRKLGDVIARAGSSVQMLNESRFGVGPRIPIVKRDRATTGCPMQLFVDYERVSSRDFDIDLLDPRDIGGIEIYSGPSETPNEFGGPNETCGTIVIWTRRR